MSDKVNFNRTEAVLMRNQGVKGAIFFAIRLSSPFGLRPNYDESRVLHFRLETGG